MTDIEAMEAQAAALAEQIKRAKTDKACADRQARLAAQRQEQADHAARMYANYAEPFGIPTSLASAIYSLAWVHGHSSGYDEVESYYGDFAEMARVAFEAGRESKS